MFSRGNEVANRTNLLRCMSPKHTAEAAAVLGPSKWLAVKQKITLETNPAKARTLGRKELSRYMVLPNYCNSWLRQGFTEAELRSSALHGRRHACLSAAYPRG
jgi:hypothetical protein